MPRIRSIKNGFFIDEDVGELSAEARVVFLGMLTIADREGRLEDKPKTIKVQVCPHDPWNIEGLLEELKALAFIIRYEVDGKRYIQIRQFARHQHPHPKEQPSEIPAPPAAASREFPRQAIKLHGKP